MKFSQLFSAQAYGLYGKIVSVEIDIARGMHSFSIIGMASRSVDESRDRVSSAIKNCGFSSPKTKNEKLVVSLAPAELKKEGAYHDLAIALGYLLSSGEIDFDPTGRVFVGELSLDGSLRPLHGILPLVQVAKQEGFREIFVPYENRVEAAMVDGITIYPVRHLSDAIRHLEKRDKDSTEESFEIEAQEPTDVTAQAPESSRIDFADVRGQELVKRGLLIAAVGGHNVAMFGSPGTGKTMLARAFAGILPPLSRDEVLEVTAIHSIAGKLPHSQILANPPFRSPHHTSSYVSLIGGGSHPQPGEISLAHRGVLFLDEFPEFDRKVIESLRQPLEDKEVTIARAQGTLVFPSSFILLAALNPCPCGFASSQKQACRCSAYEIDRYRKKISGPIMDRIDLWLPVEHIEYEELLRRDGEGVAVSETSDSLRKRVVRARAFSQKRNGNTKLNAELSSRDLEREKLGKDIQLLLNESARQLKLSPRAYHRVIKIARTIADLEEKEHIAEKHILEALQYRPSFS